jgi:hypothetical protein
MKMSNEITIPTTFQKIMMAGEEVMAVTRKHRVWILLWIFHPVNVIMMAIAIASFQQDWRVSIGLLVMVVLLTLYKIHVTKNEVIILTNKRIIGAVNPGLFTKDKIELTIKSVDNLKEDETFFGNIFGWTAIQVETRSDSYTQRRITKDSVKETRNKFYELNG